VAGDCLNISVCAHTTGKDTFDVIAWNVMAHPLTQLIRIPVTGGGNYTVTDLSTQAAVEAQAVPLTQRDYELPLLFVEPPPPPRQPSPPP
jgi:alpha-mannosidase